MNNSPSTEMTRSSITVNFPSLPRNKARLFCPSAGSSAIQMSHQMLRLRCPRTPLLPRRCRSARPALDRKSPQGIPKDRTSVEVDEWFFTERGQKDWVHSQAPLLLTSSQVEAMELNTITPELPSLVTEMGLNYDPARLASAVRNKRGQLYTRALKISTTLGTFIARLIQDYAIGQFDSNMEQRAKELTKCLTQLGPSFVKVGQALSSRPDLFPRTYLEQLSTLQDRLPSFPRSMAMTVIEQELGKPPNEIFVELSDEPVAAASLGQVYRGRLKTGEEVAVKVQRPGIGENIAFDMILLRRLMAIVDRSLIVYQPIVPLVDEFAQKLFAELDYISEGHNCEKFQQLYGEMQRIRTPGIYWKHTARRVLTMEWIEGVKLTDEAAMAALDYKLTDFVNIGVECSLRQLLDHGFFHADPHPGNLLATKEGDLVFLDFGMMSTAPVAARYALIAHVVHLVNRDYPAMCRDYYELDFMDPSVDTAPIAPALANFFDEVLDNNTVSTINFKTIIDGLGDVLFQFPFKQEMHFLFLFLVCRVPGYYALIIRSLTVLEGLALQADPNYALLTQAYTYMASRLLTDPEPRLRQSLEEVLFKNGRLRWNRFEELVKEGRKSQSFDPQQMWLLMDWVAAPASQSIRDQLAKEMASMIDAVVADSARTSLRERLDPSSLDWLIPELPLESEARKRAALMSSLWNGRSLIPELTGSGPFGILLPGDVQQVIDRFVAGWERSVPRLYDGFRQPGGIDFLSKLGRDLAMRFAARSVKLLSGARQIRAISEEKTE